jgi:hypothetical protein
VDVVAGEEPADVCDVSGEELQVCEIWNLTRRGCGMSRLLGIAAGQVEVWWQYMKEDGPSRGYVTIEDLSENSGW